MSVKDKFETVIAQAEMVKSTMKTFAIDTNDQNAKEMFNNLANSQQGIIDSLNARFDYVKEQEPQYR